MPRRGGLSVDAWLARPHVLVAMRPDAPSEIDIALAEAGMHRHVALVLPHWGAALDVVPGTDLVLTVAARAIAAAPHRTLRAFAPPIALAAVPFQQAWHARREADPAHSWLRQAVWQCCRHPQASPR